ncbi:MAG: MBL fold metallo-hydrolase [Acidobacteria bacterium]|nr:MBL fold metallo-hydrolase [Acidobacteriota bacterium]
MTKTIAALTVLVFLAGLAAEAQQPSGPPVATKLKDRVYWVKGGNGANTGFVVGTNGVLVIDAKTTTEACQAMLAEIRKVTPLPVKTVVLTHSDGDHVNGLAGFPKGLTIIAHENTRKDMQEAFKDPKLAALLPYLPTRTITGNRPVEEMDGTIRYKFTYSGPAHTSGDLVVFLPAQKIAFIGDLVFVGRDPLIHRQKGGTSIGLVQVLNNILTLDADTFIAGHTEPLTKADIRAALASIQEKQAKVKALIQEGKSLDDIKKVLGLAEVPGQPVRRFPNLIEIMYLEQTEKK